MVATNNALHFVNKSEVQADVITDEDEWKVLMTSFLFLTFAFYRAGIIVETQWFISSLENGPMYSL